MFRLHPAVAACLSVVACGGSDGPRYLTGENPPPAAAQEIAIQDNQFSPGTAGVDPGETVRWSWGGTNQHNVTFVDGTLGGSATQVEGTFSRTFPASGAFQYYCSIHGSPTDGMRGSVTVGSAPADTTTTGTGY